MNLTVELSKLYNITPFDILKQEKDAVIMLINYFIEKGRGNGNEQTGQTFGNDAMTEKEQSRAFWSSL